MKREVLVKKGFILAIFFFLFILVGKLNLALAEENRPVGMGTVCFEPVIYYRDCPPGTESKCEKEKDPPGGFPSSQKKDHTLLLRSKSPSNDPQFSQLFSSAEIFIVGCITDNDDYHCTTGDPNLDSQLYSRTGFPTSDRFFTNDPNKRIHYELEFQKKTDGAIKNPVKDQSETDLNEQRGKIDVVVRSYTPDLRNHIFLGVFPVRLNPETGEIVDEEGRTIQLGSIAFIKNEEVKELQCVSVSWDPEGYVFDAQSLQPLSGVKISLLDETGEPLPNAPGFKNPIETDRFGSYFFYVEPGNYMFRIETPGYEIVSNNEEINPDYNNLEKGHNYRCEGIVPRIYTSGQIVEEKPGQVLRCDIPVKKVSGESLAAPEYKVYEKTILADDNSHIITVRVWPHYALLRAVQGGRVLYSARAKDGVWEAVISNSNIDETQPISVEVVTADSEYPETSSLDSLGLSKKFLGQVLGIEANFSPIFPYVEGYAYDSDNQLVKNGVVYVVHKATNKPIMAVKTDENGYFRVLPEFLPPFQYYFRIKDLSGKESVIRTERFAAQNYGYFKAEEIDLLTMRRKTGSIRLTKAEKEDFAKSIVFSGKQELVSQEQQNLLPPQRNSEEKAPVTPQSEQTEVSETSRLLILFLVFSLVLVAFLVFLVLYFLKLRNSD